MPCASLESLIQWAYNGFANGRHFDARSAIRVEGGPEWVHGSPPGASADRYTINAKAEGSPGMLAMLTGPVMRALLEDRFQLKLHRATREVPVYSLTVAKGGAKLEPFKEGSCFDWEDPGHPKLPPSQEPRPNCRQWTSVVYGATMKELCAMLAEDDLDRPVIDKTGLAGMFNFALDISPEDRGIPGDVAAAATGRRGSGRPALIDPADRFDAARTALRKIGLDLKAAKGPQEAIVIDRVERPSAN